MTDEYWWIAGRLTNDAGRVLELALREALSDGKNYIEPRHIKAALDAQTTTVSIHIDGREIAKGLCDHYRGLQP